MLYYYLFRLRLQEILKEPNKESIIIGLEPIILKEVKESRFQICGDDKFFFFFDEISALKRNGIGMFSHKSIYTDPCFVIEES